MRNEELLLFLLRKNVLFNKMLRDAKLQSFLIPHSSFLIQLKSKLYYENNVIIYNFHST